MVLTNMNRPLLSESSVDNIKGIGLKKKEALARLGVNTIRDLCFFYPRKYRDFSRVYSVREAIYAYDKGKKTSALIGGKIISARKNRSISGKNITRVIIGEGVYKVELIFIGTPYILNLLNRESSFYFYGKLNDSRKKGTYVMIHPEIISKDRLKNLYEPIYPLSRNLKQGDVRKAVKAALECNLEEPLPKTILDRWNLMPLKESLYNIHIPTDRQGLIEGRRRIKFQEIFIVTLALEQLKYTRRCGTPKKAEIDPFIDSMEFVLTEGQKQTLVHIERDMESTNSMNRLLQGDVGSGKTVVASAALYKNAMSGFQGAFMVPTELLAKQHYKELKNRLEPFGITVGIITGSMTKKVGDDAKKSISEGDTQVIVGTHSLIQETVMFKNLGLVITDEQHRFGVNQRFVLKEKGINPDILLMSATPIPRTLTTVFYKDMDISTIRQLPKGRKTIKTTVLEFENRKFAYEFAEKEISKGRQVYVVVPLVEENPDLDLSSLEKTYEELSKKLKKKNISTGFVYGSMKQTDKDKVMESFYKKDIDVLVSTTVIEVGINVPNATVMIIENAERFGLAQLHQLRGRVGRGGEQSYCFLVTGRGDIGSVARERNKIMETSQDGFFISREDLKLRGPGEIFGERQHGIPDLKMVNFMENLDLVEEIRGTLTEMEICLDREPLKKELEYYCIK